MRIILIAAIGKNRELGKDNNLIWHLKEDLKFFKENTMGHIIVMGYNTYESLPNLLQGRRHIILTHRDINTLGVEVFHNLDDLLTHLHNLDEDIYIIGGASIYQQFMPYAQELLLTQINAECNEADVYFPKWNNEEFTKEIIKEVDGEIPYSHIRYRRK